MSTLPISYKQTLIILKDRIRAAQTKAILTANTQLLCIYWEIGKFIVDLEKQKEWGAKVIEQLSRDLKREFSNITGLSTRNLRYMRSFYINWPDFFLIYNNSLTVSELILQQPVAKLPWGHICVLCDRIKTTEERNFYVNKIIENNWSRNMLSNQIESNVFLRQGKLQHNFKKTLSEFQGDLAKEQFKDPYKFDFFQLTIESQERDLEEALIIHIQKFLTELGKGFAFVGRQVHVENGDKDYYIDLLFYHIKLHSYIVLELKSGDFKPEYAGKMNFYLSIIDEEYKLDGDNPSIGLILCKNKNKITAEYALRDVNKPIGIAEYLLKDAIPSNLKSELPSIEDLELELEKSIEINQKPYEKQLDKLKILVDSLNHKEVKESKSKQSVFHIFETILLKIIEKLSPIFEQEIYPLFESHMLYRTINNDGAQYYNAQEIEIQFEGNNIKQVGLTLILKGFKKAGVQVFSTVHELPVFLYDYYYEVGGNSELSWKNCLYHENWTEEEIQNLSEKWIEQIIEVLSVRIAIVSLNE